jgi:hypothetical protein
VGKTPAGLMATINDRNVRFHAKGHQPCQELSAAIGFVGCQILGMKTQLLSIILRAAAVS